MFIDFVERKTQLTLIEVIKKRINPGSIILTDCWKAYENLPELVPDRQFVHLTVNHSKHFVDPEIIQVHTQTIKSFWSVLKRKLRIRDGTNYTNNIEAYIGDHLYKRKHGRNTFMSFINHLKNYY